MNTKHNLLRIIRSNVAIKMICLFVLCFSILFNCIEQSYIFAASTEEIGGDNTHADTIPLIPYDRDKKLSAL